MKDLIKINGYRQHWALLAAVAILLVAVSWFCLRRAAPPRFDPTATSSADPRPRSIPRPQARTRAQILEPRPDRPTLSAVRLPAVMQKVLDDNAHLAKYYWLVQKVLPTEDERKTLRGMLSDLELIQTIKRDLLTHESTYSKEAEAKRMVAVEFLTDAVAWEENPAMEAVMGAIEGVVFAANISAEAPEDLAKSLAGDKMDLYTQMLHSSPARAAIIADRARGRDVEALLTYSKDWYERQTRAMKADEIQ